LPTSTEDEMQAAARPEEARPEASLIPGRRAVLGAAAVGLAALGINHLATGLPDDVAPDEIERRRHALAAALPIRLRPIAGQELAAILAALPMSPEQRLTLANAIAARSLRMAQLEVFDSDAEDGDVVKIESIGLVHTVRLTKRPVAVPVFIPSDGRLHITGVDQGLGGGVTLGVMSNGEPIKLPPLAVGESIVLRVAGL
jgi:hypothetical protein